MRQLFLADWCSALTLVLVVGLCGLVGWAFYRSHEITRWGRFVAVFILLGTAVSGLAATRDGYATSSAVFGMTSVQSNICSLAGGAIFLIGIACLIWRRSTVRRTGFFVISALFILQVLTIELSRLATVL